ADRLLTSEVIFKEDLEAIFGKRPWDPIEEISIEIEAATIESNPDNMLETGEETEPTANA
ncbi:MAG: hypothetical protein NWP99_02855, partial [Crocinitomicaceae bacterium]|nr:hypothetical protein [Crocinitomicaceae bacterium]